MNPAFSDYHQLFAAVKQRVREAQYRALQQVNQQQIQLYWDLGQLIAERQQQHGWGKNVVETLARDLQTEFVGMSGFSESNLWRMRTFFLEYQHDEFLAQAVREIPWGQNILILERCKNPAERLFYVVQARQNNWSRSTLTQQLKARAYHNTVQAQQNFAHTLAPAQLPAAVLALRDEYTFGFLGLAAEHSEHELEQALLGNVRRFLVEMGGDFTFIGNQYRLALDGQEYFVDLLLFHRELQCLVAVELKVTEFQPEHAGKMNFYSC